jgi:hypothetical protein|uniref:Uncharacterized protein n=1 Tax=Myoviridae sp. ct5xZ3 TaxID=2827601 RepID=A0A8S5RS26_9CAUD|nr:MAG TPA: hypothetical protein [Myoviridae sp. ct5xZ3]
MAIIIENTSQKVIGIGEVTVLPGEKATVPVAFETSPVLEVYKRIGAAKITGKPTTEKDTEDKKAAEEETAKVKAAEEKAAADEALRQARLASLDGISEEALASLAQELGINPADCKDQTDIIKKVKAKLKK